MMAGSGMQGSVYWQLCCLRKAVVKGEGGS